MIESTPVRTAAAQINDPKVKKGYIRGLTFRIVKDNDLSDDQYDRKSSFTSSSE